MSNHTIPTAFAPAPTIVGKRPAYFQGRPNTAYLHRYRRRAVAGPGH